MLFQHWNHKNLQLQIKPLTSQMLIRGYKRKRGKLPRIDTHLGSNVVCMFVQVSNRKKLNYFVNSTALYICHCFTGLHFGSINRNTCSPYCHVHYIAWIVANVYKTTVCQKSIGFLGFFRLKLNAVLSDLLILQKINIKLLIKEKSKKEKEEEKIW